jgi:DNA topoisomerase-1
MSNKILVIVESPGKISTITKHLESIKNKNDNYIVKASYGHIQDLDSKTLSIDIENNFNPIYITNPDKVKVVSELKK